MPARSEILSSFLKVPDYSALPERIRTTIRRREWENEIVLRLIQLSVILLFCFIYAISPKTSPEGAIIFTPYVLGTYLVLSIFGLVWGLRAEPPEWSVYLSILFDFSLLYGLMIGFHIQYGQPASFILKAPALLYVFIFIAIRALRFRARFVVTAGLVAALGWAAVIYYVTALDPGDNMLTRSYVEYLTANRILIGAEVDKILSILFVTAILALAVNASTNLLVTAVTERSAADDFSRFFDSDVARDIRSNRLELEAGRGERRKITIVNIDIRGFSGLSTRLDADIVMGLLTAYREWASRIIQSEGGQIDKFIGDGIMVVFGAGDGAPAHAASALRAAEQLLATRRDWQAATRFEDENNRLEIGIGIATGQVTWGAIGHKDRLELTVIGPAANLSAKLEKHNKQRGSLCICDLTTWTLAREQGYSGRFSGRQESDMVEGVPGPVDLVELSLETEGDAKGEPVEMIRHRRESPA